MGESRTSQGKLGDWLSDQPFTLALSSSFFGFFAHAAVVAALEHVGLKPQKVSGSSAGALIAGAVGSGFTPKETQNLLFSIRRADFWDPAVGFGLLRGRLFCELLEKNFVRDFDDAKTPIEVSAFDVKTLRTQYLNSGHLASAILASCAVPGLFHPVKRDRRLLLDGGILNKSGLNPTESRAISVYFQSPGRWGDVERKMAERKLKDGQRFLVYQSLTKVNPRQLDLGPKAYDQAFARTLKALDLPLGSEA